PLVPLAPGDVVVQLALGEVAQAVVQRELALAPREVHGPATPPPAGDPAVSSRSRRRWLRGPASGRQRSRPDGPVGTPCGTRSRRGARRRRCPPAPRPGRGPGP